MTYVISSIWCPFYFFISKFIMRRVFYNHVSDGHIRDVFSTATSMMVPSQTRLNVAGSLKLNITDVFSISASLMWTCGVSDAFFPRHYNCLDAYPLRCFHILPPYSKRKSFWIKFRSNIGTHKS